MQTLSFSTLRDAASNPYFALIVGSLTTWRISSLLVYEEGPWNIFGRFRSRIGVYYDEFSERQGRNEFARLFNCVWCLSPYIGTIFTFTWMLFPFIIWFGFPLAMSAVAIMMENFVARE